MIKTPENLQADKDLYPIAVSCVAVLKKHLPLDVKIIELGKKEDGVFAITIHKE